MPSQTSAQSTSLLSSKPVAALFNATLNVRKLGTLLAAVCLSTLSAAAQNLTIVPTISTIAGNGSGGFSGMGGPATSAGIGGNSAHNAVVDGAGNTYLALFSQHRVVKIDTATGIISTFVGTGSASSTGDGGLATNATINGPAGMVLSPTGVLYIADSNSQCVRAVNLATNIINTYAGVCGSSGYSGDGGLATSAVFSHLDGFALDAAGDLYINDVPNYRIRRVDATTKIVTTVVGTGSGGFSGDGGPATSAQIGQCYTVAIDSQGNLYFGDNQNNRVRKVTSSTGIITTIAGTGTAGFSGDGGPATAAQLNTNAGGPGIAADADGNVYINDYNNNRIRKVTAATGIITTIVGTGTSGFSGDGGPATSAQLNTPKRVGFDLVRGSILVSDTGNNRLRRLMTIPLTFPPTQVGSSSATEYYYLQTTAGVSISSITIPPSQGGIQEFKLGSITGCTVDGTTVNPAGTVCKVAVTFSPAYSGSRQVAVHAVTSTGSINFSMQGTGLAPQVLVYPGNISTVAGTGTAGASGDGGAATSALLTAPSKSVVDAFGNLYIAEPADNRVRKVAAGTGVITTIAGTGAACSSPTSACGDAGAATSATLLNPTGVAIDGGGNVYVADSGDSRIRVVNQASGTISTFAGTGVAGYTGDNGLALAATFSNPTALTIDSNGTVYVVDAGNNAIRRIATGTNIVSTVAGNGVSCSSPTNACGDGGQASAASLNAPSDVAVDAAENLYIADTGDNRIRFVSALNSVISTVAGSGSAGFSGDGGSATSASLDAPAGLLLDGANDLFIADSANNVVRLVNSATGTIQTIAGNTAACSPSTGACGDAGLSTSAMLSAPAGIAIDSQSNLYITDTGDNRIRKVSGMAATFAFAATPVNSTSSDSPRTITVLDAGNQALTFPAPTSGTDPAISAQFSLSNAGTCPNLSSGSSPQTLASGASCTYVVSFTPTRAGAVNGTLAITDSALNAASPNYATQTITLNGTGTKDNPTATLTTSNAAPVYGQTVALTDTISIVGGVAPTGTVTFYNGATAIGTGTINASGIATLTTASLPVGSDSITAVYGGDSNYASITAGPITETVSPMLMATSTLTTSNATPALGAQVTFTDTLGSVGGVQPTGTVIFYSGSTSLGSATVPASGVVTFSTSMLLNGTDSITAVYQGDTNYAQSTSNVVTETVGSSETVASTASLTSSVNPSSYGQSTTLTSTVASTNGGATPTGTVTFYTPGTPTVVNLQATGTSTTISQTLNLAAGTYSVSILGANNGGLYNGWNPASNPTTNNRWTDRYGLELCTSCAATVNDMAGDPGTSTDIQALAAFQAAATLNDTFTSRQQGQTVNNPYTFTLTSPQSVSFYVPDGTFVNGAFTVKSSFADDSGGLSLAVTPLTSLGSGALDGSGTATLAISTLPIGTNPIVAVYSGDSTYVPSSSATLNQVVTKITGTDVLTTSNASPMLGQAVTFTDTLPTVNGVTPTGIVTFYNGSTLLGTGTIASGAATLTTSSLPVGTDNITAVYGGDGNFAGSTSNAVTESVAKSSSADTLTTSNASPTFGQSVTFTDTIPVIGGIAPTGTVTFYSGTSVIGTGAVSPSGISTLATTTLTAGIDSVTAVYGGDSNYDSVTSNAVLETVGKATTVLPAPTVIPANMSYGSSVTISLMVPANETGTVTFYSGTTVLGTAAISNGVATIVTTALPAGTDSITGQTSGDANYNPALSPATTDVVSKITNTIPAPAVSPLNAPYGTSVTITETLPADETGTVTFLNGTTVLGTGTIVNGVATITTTALPAGTDSITAQTSGDGDYNSATSPATTDTVGKSTSTLAAPVVNPPNSPYGTTVTITEAVPSDETGTVTFYVGTTELGTATISNGTAVLTTSALPAGTDSITARTSGDSNYGAATSPATIDQVAKVTGTDMLTTSNASPTFGQSVTFTNTIPTVNGTTPTGTVTFYSGTTVLGTGTLDSQGVATLTTMALPVGIDSITALYGGDSNYGSTTTGPITETVGQANGPDTLTTSDASPLAGEAVTFTDTIPTVGGVAPTGTVTFYNGTTAIGTGTVNAAGVATLTVGSLPVGASTITAVYSGDTNYASVTAGPITENVSKSSSPSTLTTSNASINLGQSVTFTNTIPVVGGVAPTGTVTFYSGTTSIGTGTLNASGVATLTTTTLTAGSDLITAVYPGDGNYQSTNGGPLTETVAKSTAATTLSTSNAAPTYGQSVTFTDTIPVVAGIAPTGTVTFYDGTTVLGTGTVSATGVATLATTALPAGTSSITAVYAGDSNYASSTSNAVAENVAKAAGGDTLTSSSASLTVGQSVTFTDTIPTVGGVAPTGTVTFYNGTTVIGTGTVDSSGIATLTTGSLPAGTDSITAVYGGDSNYGSSTSNAVTENVTKAVGSDTLSTSDPAPLVGQQVTFSDAIPVVGGIAPTGTVTFYNGTTVIGTGTINSSGIAKLTTGSLPAGSDSITAVYAGDANYAGGTSNAVIETVGKAVNTDTLTTSNPAPALGQPVTLTDTIPVSGGIAPTGTVTFYSGNTVIGTGTVNSSGIATLTTSSLPAGTDSITAVYGGDNNYSGSNAGPVLETVSKVAGTDTLTSSNTSVTVGQNVTFTDTIPVIGGIAPTGTVTFYNGKTAIGTGTVNASGIATLTTGALPAGTDIITAVYAGDSNYDSATSNAVTENVQKISGSDVLTTSNPTPNINQAVTFTDTLPITGGITPTGTVTFYNGTTVIGTGTVNASGVATLTTTSLPGGIDTITAVYAGDSSYSSSTSNAVTETVAKETTVDVLTTSSPATVFGQTVTFTDTIPSTGGTVPTGTVTFYDGTTVIGTGTVNASGVAVITTGSLPVGSDTITAVYSGDSQYASEKSNAVVVVVSKGTTNSALTTSNPAINVGQAVTFTDTINLIKGIAPTGTVTFYDGTTVIGTGTINASGVATITTTTLPAGTDTITAVYGGDTNYGISNAGPVTETVSVAQPPATTEDVLTASATSRTIGQAVTFTDTITKTGSAAPTGTVTFYDGSTVIGTGTVDASGVATFTTSVLAAGTHTITAVYSGDVNYSEETSNSVTVTVIAVPADFTITATPPTQTINPGDSVQYTVALGGLNVPFNQSVVLSATGLPPGATVSFSPASLVPGAGPTDTTMTIVTSPTQAQLENSNGLSSTSYALLLLPLLGVKRFRKQLRKLPRGIAFSLLLLLGLGTIGSLTGCGGGYFGLPPHSYTITVTGTSGALHHSTTVTLTVR